MYPLTRRFVSGLGVLVLCSGISFGQSRPVPNRPAADRGNPQLEVAQPSLTLLGYHVVDAAYSRALDRVVTISAAPDVLHIYDPVSKADQTVPLSHAPLALSVGPDGLFAVVAHVSSISYINLQTASVVRVLIAFNPNSAIVLAGNGYFYTSFQAVEGGIDFHLVSSGSGGTEFTEVGQVLRLRPTANQLIASVQSGLAAFDISQGISRALGQLSPGTLDICGNIWLSEDGGHLYTACAKSYSVSGDLTPQVAYIRMLSDATSLTWAEHSSIQKSVAVIPGLANPGGLGDTEIQLYDDTLLNATGRITLPMFTGANSFAGHGKFVFWNSTATKLIVLEQADSSANLAADYGVFVIAPGGTGDNCTFSIGPATANYGVSGGADNIPVATGSTCAWTAHSNASWLSISSGSFTIGPGSVGYVVSANTGGPRTGTITVADQTFTVTQAGVAGSVTLNPPALILPSSTTAGYILVTASFPTFAWTAQSSAPWLTIISGASGTGNGQVNYVAQANTATDPRTAVISIGGTNLSVTQQAASATTVGLQFTAVTPCRIVDTRPGGVTQFPFGAPDLLANTTRDFPIPASICGLPGSAQAYALNVTVVPEEPLNYLTLWPTGQAQPFVSTLNSFDGRTVANAAIVPAGTNGSISVYTTNRTDVVIDVTGYFDSQNPQGLSFYAAAPCRVADTRNPVGPFGGPSLTAAANRDFAVLNSGCGIPITAKVYSTNVTAVPAGPLYFLSAWPTGQPQPLVSTLNSFDGTVVANAAILSAGTNGSVTIGVTGQTDVILDTNGYFAPPGAPTPYSPAAP